MCGIVGVVASISGNRRPPLDRAVAALGHRGPDGSGMFEGPGIALGHTRLSIIDPTTASDQPMTHPETGCVLVFNGEIYNYQELRELLKGRGHHFLSAGDTEVLLHSYLEWGDRCVEELNGMFAFAVWDPRTGSVFMARDRVGEKPLHLCRSDGDLWFSSEIKALVAAGAAQLVPDPDYMFGFLAAGDLGHPRRTCLEGVQQLPAGHAARITTGSAPAINTWPFWQVGRGAERALRSGDVSAAFDALFRDSIRLRLRSDVPLGTSLSGGLDSSLVLATVREMRPAGELHAFTASFPGSAADELPRAHAVADRVGATIHPVPLHASDLVEGLDAMILANEGPVESPSTFAQFEVMAEARRVGITVLLDGQGADETWAGYDKYTSVALLDRILTLHPAGAFRLAADWRTVRGRTPRPAIDRYIGLVGGATARSALAPMAMRLGAPWLSVRYRKAHRATDVLDGAAAQARIGDVAACNALLDLSRITLPRLLRYADRNSMAWSREVRLPFLDHRLIELSTQVPMRSKVVGGWTKEPIRRALSRLGLEDVARRRDKLAYMPPTDEWLSHPALDLRVRDAWSSLYRAGYLASPRPVAAALPRWRVLSIFVWAQTMGIELPPV